MEQSGDVGAGYPFSRWFGGTASNLGCKEPYTRVYMSVGVGKVLAKVRHRFYWVGQRQDVQGWCNSCRLCGSTKSPPKHRHAPLQADVSTTPMQRVAMDILGPLPLTPRSNK